MYILPQRFSAIAIVIMLMHFKMKFFPVLCLVFAEYLKVVLAYRHHTIYVSTNPILFPCPPNITNCKSVTFGSLTKSSSSLRVNDQENEFIVQSGTHKVTKKFSLKATRAVTVRGQNNTMIICAGNFKIIVQSRSKIFIGDIRFHRCSIIVKTSSGHSKGNFITIKSKVSSSNLIVDGGNVNTLTLYIENVNLINFSSFLVKNAKHINIEGNGSSLITCENSQLLFLVGLEGIKISDLKFHNCFSVNVSSQSQKIPIEIYEALFDNSSLLFTTNKKDSEVLMSASQTKFEGCSCKSIQLNSKIGILSKINVTLNDTIISDNSQSFIESKDDHPVSITIMGNCGFYGNKNFIFYLNNGVICFTKANVSFLNGTAEVVEVGRVKGAPIYSKSSSIIFKESSVRFEGNQGLLCGGIVAESTQIYFQDNVTIIFNNNRGLNGGALSLYAGSRLHFTTSGSNKSLSFQSNTAQIGGAIYVEDSGYQYMESVFKLHCEPESVEVVFGDNNVASFSGHQIFGGWIDWNVNKGSSNVPKNQMDVVNSFIKFSNEHYTQVSSYPIRICLCLDNVIRCNITQHNMTMYGKALSLSLVGVGQRYTPVISQVETSLLGGRKFQYQSSWQHGCKT